MADKAEKSKANSASGSNKVDATTRSILDHWYRDSPDDRLAHLVRDAARGLTRALQFRLADHGISFGHWAFLRILWARDGLSQRELSVQAGLMESTTHTALNRMEKLGFLIRRHQSGNRRRLHVYLTESGKALQEKLEPLAEDANAVATEGLSTEEIELMRRCLLTMITNLAADEQNAIERGQRIQSTRDLGQRNVDAGEQAAMDSNPNSNPGSHRSRK